ncbi:MAG: DNA-binding protein, partial [Bacteroidaceae bacterium]|nr:DNA-binding protein [Bacteroidaceae bacterium]
MKLKYFFAALAAVFTLGLIVSCGEDFEPTYQDGLTVSQSSVAISTEGGSATIDVNAADAWTIENIPTWLTVTPASGSAGTTQVTFSAEANAAGQTGEVVIKMGDKEQHIKVYQGVPTVTAATCAEVIKGIDGKSYLVTGVVTKIAESATYGNFYINDGTGEVYIYGTLYDGKTKQGALLKYGIEVGDEVTVQGPRKDYNGTIELVDVEVIKVNKSLLKLDSITVNNDNIAADLEKQPLAKEGSDFTVHLACKTANGISVAVPEDAQSWLS